MALADLDLSDLPHQPTGQSPSLDLSDLPHQPSPSSPTIDPSQSGWRSSDPFPNPVSFAFSPAGVKLGQDIIESGRRFGAGVGDFASRLIPLSPRVNPPGVTPRVERPSDLAIGASSLIGAVPEAIGQTAASLITPQSIVEQFVASGALRGLANTRLGQFPIESIPGLGFLKRFNAPQIFSPLTRPKGGFSEPPIQEAQLVDPPKSLPSLETVGPSVENIKSLVERKAQRLPGEKLSFVIVKEPNDFNPSLLKQGLPERYNYVVYDEKGNKLFLESAESTTQQTLATKLQGIYPETTIKTSFPFIPIRTPQPPSPEAPTRFRRGSPPTTVLPEEPYGAHRYGIDRLYHETSPDNAVTIAMSFSDKMGLQVAADPSMALGQSAKGALVEFTNTQAIGVQTLKHKPGLAVASALAGKPQEFRILRAPSDGKKIVASITLKPGVPISRVNKLILQRSGWSKNILPDGTLRFTNPLMSQTAAPVSGDPSVTPPGAPPAPPVSPQSQPGGLPGPEPSGEPLVQAPQIAYPLGKTDVGTARNIRESYVGEKNVQIARGTQFANTIKRLVPNLLDRQGMFWNLAAKGDPAIIQQALSNPKFSDYKPQLEAALKLPPQTTFAMQQIQRYYQQSGEVSQKVGTIHNIRENYQNRIYQPEPPQDYVKTELQQGLKQTTRHGKARVFDTEFEAVEAGKKFATTDVADALAIHNEEMARVNTSRALAEHMVTGKLAAWKRPDNIPDGWEQVGTLQKNVPIKDAQGQAVIGESGDQVVSKSVLVAPQGIAKGLAAIADPNYARRIESLRHLQNYQGLVKTVDLGFSLFHHFTMVAQVLYQGGVRTLLDLPTMMRRLDSPEFGSLEQDFVQNLGMTAVVQSNQDILRDLVTHERETFGNILNLPGVKQTLRLIDRSSNFLFGKIQRFLKVSNYGKATTNWVATHPNSTNAEVTSAKRGYAREINAAFGGLNWEAMGMTKSNLSLLRLGLLAPDWTISNIQLLQYAVGDKGTAGAASRAHILRALIGGIVLTEGLNKLLTGHTTDQNSKGHALEIEVSPNVYVSLLRGGIGDITKFGSMVSESGLAGVTRFAQGKLAPLPRTAMGLLTNTQYTGGPIATKDTKKNQNVPRPIRNTYEVLKYALTNAAPVPFGLSNLERYRASQGATPIGQALVVTGLARFSKPPKPKLSDDEKAVRRFERSALRLPRMH